VSARTPNPSAAEAVVGLLFLCSAAAAVALAAVYWRGGQPQAEGVLLAVSFGTLGAGFVVWAHHLLPNEPHTEAREPLASPLLEQEALEASFERGGALTRRRFILGALGSAVVAIGAALAFPIRSLGPQPDDALAHTAWRAGTRLVTSDGRPVAAADIPPDSLITVFPEGAVAAADGPAVLMRIDPALLGRPSGAPDGLIAFSKVCTHAGCPVGLYEKSSHQLLCPCHQSAFAVLEDARPVSGPADRALPQLPLTIDAHGVLRALGDFDGPVGPRTWHQA
jgi:ubiquinol-cytochrome c reductase iron-sulfur subunit